MGKNCALRVENAFNEYYNPVIYDLNDDINNNIEIVYDKFQLYCFIHLSVKYEQKQTNLNNGTRRRRKIVYIL